MKKKIGLFLLLITVGGMVFAQTSVQIDRSKRVLVDFLPFKNAPKVRALGFLFKYDGCQIVYYTMGGGGDPKEWGPLHDNKGQRRFPNIRNGTEHLSSNITSIRTRQGQTVEIAINQEVEWYKPSAQNRLLIIQPNSHVDFNLEGEDRGFVLRSGSIKEDQSFRTAASFDELMSAYACVPEKMIQSTVDGLRGTFKTNDALANAIITNYSVLSGGFGALTGLAPGIMLPAEFAYDMMLNVIKAQCAYALAYCYKVKSTLEDPDGLKDDLYILLDDDAVEVTLGNIAQAAGVSKAKDTAWDIASKEALLSKLSNTKAFTSAIKKINLPTKVAGKFTVKGVAKGIPVVSLIVGTFDNAKEVVKFGSKAKQFYGPPAPAASPPSPSPGPSPSPSPAPVDNKAATVNAAVPKISKQPSGASVSVGAILTLSVAATISDNGSLSYQWYKNNTPINSGGTSLGTANGANTANYKPPTTTAGSYTYYCVVKNTNNNVNGSKTASLASNIANITVNAPPDKAAADKKTYTVTFHRNGGTSAAIPKATTGSNGKVNLPAPPTRPNYTFTGWNTKENGSGTAFTANTTVTADIEVWAQWKK